MDAKARYKLNSHLERLMNWQIAQLEAYVLEEARRKLAVKAALRQAHKSVKLGIPQVRRANVEYYNRVLTRAY